MKDDHQSRFLKNYVRFKYYGDATSVRVKELALLKAGYQYGLLVSNRKSSTDIEKAIEEIYQSYGEELKKWKMI